MRFDTRKVVASKIGTVDFDHLSFGEIFSDHMFRMDYADGGWQEPRILPFGKIEILPSLSTLHYGQSVFEGLKAFHSVNGGLGFRREHAEDAPQTACAYPAWTNGCSWTRWRTVRLTMRSRKKGTLCTRPFTFATEDYIGVRSREVQLLCNRPSGRTTRKA